MARVKGQIPNFINGISQQPPELRLSSQGASQVNCYSTVAKGLKRRPPTETLAKIAGSVGADVFTHIINRDVNERYVVVIDPDISTTTRNKLSSAQSRQTSGWSASSVAVVATSTPNSTDSSIDGVTNYQRLVFDGTDGTNYSISSFSTLADGSYIASIWARRVSGTFSDTDNKLTISGAGVSATASVSLNTLVADLWTLLEVPFTASGHNGSNIKFGVYSDDVMTIDTYGAHIELASTYTTTQADGITPQIRVFDFTGTEQQVWLPNGQDYIKDAVNASTSLRALTVADYTFVVNSSMEVEADATTSDAEEYSALISVSTVQPGTDVKVIVNGTTVSTTTTSDTDPSDLETNYIAAQIKTDLAATAPTNAAPWSHSLTETEGSVVYLKNSSADFQISVRDGSNGLGIKIIKRKVQYFEDLPRQGKNGFKVEVAGDPVTGFGNYWVEFEGNENGIPVWKESMAPGILTSLNDETMPHKLVRNASDTFTFDKVTWTDRRVGDNNNNPMPSFVGETINDIYFTEGRLAVLAAENTIMSEAGEFFNFFRTTVTTLVDGDPIDVGTNHTKVSILRHAVPYQEQLLLFSDQTQFRLTKGDVLSPQSVGIEPITEFESSILAKPAPVGNFVFFAVEKSDYASIREYYVADQNLRNDARDITGHVPNYLPSGVTSIEGSSNEDVVLLQTSQDPENLYVYKYFWSGDQKVQSSWSVWNWPDVEEVLGKHFIQSTLYLVVRRSDGVFIEKMEMDSGAQDDSGTGYVLCMDRKVISSDSDHVSASYDSGTDQTTYTFSQITWKSVPKIVGVTGNSVDYPAGYEVAIVGDPSTYNANTIVVAGDTTAETFLFGLPFDSSYEVSEVVVKNRTNQNTEVPIGEGRLQLMWMTVVFADTGYLKITVENTGRDANYYEYTGRTIGDAGNAVGTLPIGSGKLRVPVFTKSDRATITLSSDSILPWQIISADWIGNFVSRIRSM